MTELGFGNGEAHPHLPTAPKLMYDFKKEEVKMEGKPKRDTLLCILLSKRRDIINLNMKNQKFCRLSWKMKFLYSTHPANCDLPKWLP